MAAMDETTGELIEGADDIRQSVGIILRTRIGSCVGRREFGSLVPDLIDQPMTRANILRIYAATVIALTRWEDRIRLDQVGLMAGASRGSAVEGHRLFLGQHDFFGDQRHLLEASGRLSIIMNPPFSFQNGKLVRGLAERCIRQALSIATHKVCALLPLKWLASEGRYRLFTDETPIGVWILCERPSMPPGDMIEALGSKAYDHGKIDYMWVVWDKQAAPLSDLSGRPFAPTYWIPPREKAAMKERQLAA